MKRSRERGTRGKSSEDRLRIQTSKINEYEKQLKQLRKYVRQLEGQIGISEEPEPIHEPDDKDPQAVCNFCKSTNVTLVMAYKIDKPVMIKICKDCQNRSVV